MGPPAPASRLQHRLFAKGPLSSGTSNLDDKGEGTKESEREALQEKNGVGDDHELDSHADAKASAGAADSEPEANGNNNSEDGSENSQSDYEDDNYEHTVDEDATIFDSPTAFYRGSVAHKIWRTLSANASTNNTDDDDSQRKAVQAVEDSDVVQNDPFLLERSDKNKAAIVPATDERNTDIQVRLNGDGNNVIIDGATNGHPGGSPQLSDPSSVTREEDLNITFSSFVRPQKREPFRVGTVVILVPENEIATVRYQIHPDVFVVQLRSGDRTQSLRTVSRRQMRRRPKKSGKDWRSVFQSCLETELGKTSQSGARRPR